MAENEAGCSASVAGSAEDKKTISLRSSDEQVFEVEEGVAFLSKFIKDLVEDTGRTDAVIPLSNVDSKVLAKVLEYCNFIYTAEQSSSSDKDASIKEFESDFFKLDKDALFDLILAANYLNIQRLLDNACQTVANMIQEALKGPDGVERVRQLFGIKNDFTPKEEEQVRKENAWAFE